jgi:hypothetical protein
MNLRLQTSVDCASAPYCPFWRPTFPADIGRRRQPAALLGPLFDGNDFDHACATASASSRRRDNSRCDVFSSFCTEQAEVLLLEILICYTNTKRICLQLYNNTFLHTAVSGSERPIKSDNKGTHAAGKQSAPLLNFQGHMKHHSGHAVDVGGAIHCHIHSVDLVSFQSMVRKAKRLSAVHRKTAGTR